MSAAATLSVYCVLIVLVSLVGGWAPGWVRMTHQRVELAVSFVAGVMLGVAAFHLLPHAAEALGSMRIAAPWMIAGLLTMFFLERFFCYHHHTIPTTGETPADGHGHQEHEHAGHGHSLGWAGALTGFTIHTLAAGVALAASVEAGMAGSNAVHLAGAGTFLVIFLHKPLDSLTIGALMTAGGSDARLRQWVNTVFALLVPVGVGLFHLGLRASDHNTFLGGALAFSAGTFLCISLSDLLPELQFHAHDRGKLSAALLAGLLAAYGIAVFEYGFHDHTGGKHAHDAAAAERPHRSGEETAAHAISAAPPGDGSGQHRDPVAEQGRH